MTSPQDIWILGGGPAAWCLAAAASQQGLRVGLVAPEPRAVWGAHYGVWAEDWKQAGLPEVFAQCWPTVAVRFSDHSARFSRPYASVCNHRLSQEFQGRAAAVEVVSGSVAHTDGQRITLDSGSTLEGSVVVDATGAGSPFLHRHGTSTGATQTAWGIDAEVEHWPHPPSEALFMDFSGDTHDVGSFLYALPRSEHRVFLEETSLAASPALPLPELQRRLNIRLEQRGIQVRHIHSIERCVIPMDPPLPRVGQPVVGFGAAASLVHPATGYTLLQTLSRASAVAEAIHHGLGSSGGSPERARALAQRAVWPRNRRRTNRLHRYGLRTLLSLSDTQQRAFFERFFALPESRWAAYLHPDAPLSHVCAAMLQLFVKADMPLRWHLATAGLSFTPRTSVRASLHGGST